MLKNYVGPPPLLYWTGRKLNEKRINIRKKMMEVLCDNLSTEQRRNINELGKKVKRNITYCLILWLLVEVAACEMLPLAISTYNLDTHGKGIINYNDIERFY